MHVCIMIFSVYSMSVLLVTKSITYELDSLTSCFPCYRSSFKSAQMASSKKAESKRANPRLRLPPLAGKTKLAVVMSIRIIT